MDSADLNRNLSILVAVLVLVCLTSCRHGDVEIVPVEGTITYGGGEWPITGTLYFTPVEAAPGVPLRPGWARFDKDGRFRATTLKEGDGLIPGKYQVAVEALSAPWIMGQPKPKSCVPEKFESPLTSALAVDVTPGQRKVKLQWDVPKP